MKEGDTWIHFRLESDEKIFLCKRCLTLSTRPRVVYNEDGVCNACLHVATKKNGGIDWGQRWRELENLCDRYRREDNQFDVIVPCSGGKDGSYVAWKIKHDLGMQPLCVTLKPQMQTDVGRRNLANFIRSGFDHILINPNPRAYQKLAQIGFKEQGRPKMPFVTGVSTVIPQLAIKFDIPFIIFGEEGETEYGGVTSLGGRSSMDRKETVDIYFSGFEPDSHVGQNGLTAKDLVWWKLPSQEKLDRTGINMVFWSYFEDWDPEVHAKLAREKCGLSTVESHTIGTYTNYAQLDDKLQDLHAYMMHIKFGFGRAWSDACIDIRAGRITREQGLEYVKKYDGNNSPL